MILPYGEAVEAAVRCAAIIFTIGGGAAVRIAAAATSTATIYY